MHVQPAHPRTKARVLCAGEALIDVVAGRGEPAEHVGGSLLNVAAGLAALGHPVRLAAWWGRDARGERLTQWTQDAGVEIVRGTDAAVATSVAYATLDEQARATYTFDLTWDLPELADLDADAHLHAGSIGATLEPGGTKVVAAARALREHGTVSYDPNVRPALMGSPEQVLGRIEGLIALADVVKASDEDTAWLYPGASVDDVMARWLALGPAMVVVTRGGEGASVLLAGTDDPQQVAPLSVELADTVGAGDSFMAGLLGGLLDEGLLGSTDARARLRDATFADVLPAVRRAVLTSGITVQHHGAYAPTASEIEALESQERR